MSDNEVNHPYGEQIVKIRPSELRVLGLMPRDVEIVGAIAPPPETIWIPEGAKFAYFHIKSTVSFGRPLGAPLCIEDVYEFFNRYITLRREWASSLELDLALFSQTRQVPSYASANPPIQS